MDLIGIIAAIATILGAIVTCIVFLVRLDTNVKNIDEILKNLPCGYYGGCITNLDTDIKLVKNDNLNITNNVKRIYDNINSINNRLDNLFFKDLVDTTMKKSPTTLTELGERIYKRFGGDEFLNDYKEYFFNKLDYPTTAYDVEQRSLTVLLNEVNTSIFVKIKNILYNEPQWDVKNKDVENDKEIITKRTITIMDVCYVFSIKLRDMYLERYPQLIPE